MKEFVKSISKLLDRYNIEYLIVGGAAMMLYNKKLQTKDLDILVLKTKENLKKFDCIVKNEQLISDLKKNKIIRIIGKPYSIDFHPKLDGLFEIDVFKNRSLISVDGQNLKVISLNDLEKNLLTVKNNVNGIIRTQI